MANKASYKKGVSKQQYIVKRKNVLSKVEAKLKSKKSSKTKTVTAVKGRGGRPKTPKTSYKSVTSTKPLAIAETKPELQAQLGLPRGQPATLHYKGQSVKIDTKIRYETMKTEPLIKTVNVADGEIVHKRFEGPAKELVWVDDQGQKHDKTHVKLMQLRDDGNTVPVEISKTKDIDVEPVDPKVMDSLQPYSFLEIWGESDQADDSLRDFAFDLAKNHQIGAVKKFSHGFGKLYVGFIRPVMSSDGKVFSIELMLSENKKKYRRWMPSDAGTAKKKRKADEPEVPTMW